MDRLPFAHENLAPPGDPNRGPAFVDRELNALANNVSLRRGRIVHEPDRRRQPPKAIGLTETIGHRLPALPNYGEPIRSTSTPGRANVALYLRDGLKGEPVEWVQHRETWPATQHDGPHPARATLVKELDSVAVVVGHAPPAVPGAKDAREEWETVTVRILRRYSHVIWLGDPNGLLGEVLRRLGDPRAVRGGDETDAVLLRGYTITAAPTPERVNGVPMLTDHRKALLGRAVRR